MRMLWMSPVFLLALVSPQLAQAGDVVLDDLTYCGTLKLELKPDGSGRLQATKIKMSAQSIKLKSSTMDGAIACGKGARDFKFMGSSIGLVKQVNFPCDNYLEFDLSKETNNQIFVEATDKPALKLAVTSGASTETSEVATAQQNSTAQELSQLVNQNKAFPQFLQNLIFSQSKLFPVPVTITKLGPLVFKATNGLVVPNGAGETNEVSYCVDAGGSAVKFSIIDFMKALKEMNDGTCKTCPKGHSAGQ